MKNLLNRLLGRKALKPAEASKSSDQVEADRLIAEGNALEDAGQAVTAETCYRQALALCPDLARAALNLGNALSAQGKGEEAAAAYQEALRLEPGYGAAHANLGRLYFGQRRYPQSADHYAAAVQALPCSADALVGLGAVLEELQRLAEAERAYRQALTIDPGFPGAKQNLGRLLITFGQADLDQKRYPQAIEHYTEALRMFPDSANTWVGLGCAFASLKRHAEAERAFQQALTVEPDHVLAKSNLGVLFLELRELERAANYFEEALAIMPDYGPNRTHLVNAIMRMGLISEGLKHIRWATKLDSHDSSLHILVPYCMNHFSEYAPGELFAAHRDYIERFYAKYYPEKPTYSNTPDPERRLKIGYVSGDFYDHAIARFIEPVLVYHDHAFFEVHGFVNNSKKDWVTDRFEKLVDSWHPIWGKDDDRVAELIRNSGIDILIDLSGYTENHRLGVFARKPAPVQATWMGYLNTTGLATMDYRICDIYTDPPGLTERFHTEQLARLPDCQWCHIPYNEFVCENIMPIGELPLLRNGYPILGSFNNVAKLNDRVLTLWAEMLNAIPDARLRIAAIPADRTERHITQVLRQADAPLERIEFVPRLPYPEYLKLLNETDIALDSFPYNGGTTSFDILLMGVPLITLTGDRSIARGGATLLTNIGLTELIASSPQEFISIVQQLVSDPVRLAALRHNLRERVEASPLMDGEQFTRNLEVLYRQMWRTWCIATTHNN